jgi:hypothetical protein
MITKTQLKAGLQFRYKTMKYSLKGEEDQYCIIGGGLMGYVGNIESIGTKSFTIYTYVMGKAVKVKVNYSDCELVVE